MDARRARTERQTRETTVAVEVDLDGSGDAEVATGVAFFDHMLEQLARHGHLDLRVSADGDLEVDAHHTVEDVGIALGEALAEAWGDRAGVERYGDAAVPIDESLARAAIDLSGRPYLVYEVESPVELIGTYETSLTEHFLEAVTANAKVTLHVDLVRGANTHHVHEAVFKAVAVALRRAVAVTGTAVPSTKGSLA